MAYDVLIVDDEKDIRELVSGVLQDENYSTRLAEDGSIALSMIKNQRPNLVILDVWLGESDRDGLKILELMNKDHPDVPVIMISGHSTIETAVNAIKNGAYDFIEKPFSTDRLLIAVKRALDSAKMKKEVHQLKIRAAISNDNALLYNQADIKNFIKISSTNDKKILITGEVGVGKETLALSIHENSPRKDSPFLVFRSGNFHSNFLEAELFGVEIENNDPSLQRKIGLLEQAFGSTLYVEEVGNFSLSLQAKLASYIKEGSFYRVGGKKPIKFDVRMIFGSTKNLANMVKEGLFRQDLFYMISSSKINVPPLRERTTDFVFLLQNFMSSIAKSKGCSTKKFDESAIAILQSYSWPQNFHQLRNLIERLLVVNSGQENSDVITSKDLPSEIISNTPLSNTDWSKNDQIIIMPLREAREIFEKQYLSAQIQRFDGNVSQTAKFIGMERSALHRKLKSLGVENIKKEEGF